MNHTSGKSKWTAEQWFDELPADLLRNPLMDDDQFELLIGREMGIAEGANVEVDGLREHLESARRALSTLEKFGVKKASQGDDA